MNIIIKLSKLGELKGKVIITDIKIIGENKFYILKLEAKNRYCVKKKEDLYSIKEEDFKYDNVLDIENIDDKYFLFVSKFNGEMDFNTGKCCGTFFFGKIEYGKEKNVDKKIIFTAIEKIKRIGNDYYFANIGELWGYIKVGQEHKFKEKIIFDYVSAIYKLNNEYYYIVWRNKKGGYIKLGEETKSRRKLMFDYVSMVEKIDKEYYYKVMTKHKFGYVKLGEEETTKTKIIYDTFKRFEYGLFKDEKGVYFLYGDKNEKVYIKKTKEN